MSRSFWTVAIAILALCGFVSGTDHKETAKAAEHAPQAPASQPEVKFTTPDVADPEHTPAPAAAQAPAHETPKHEATPEAKTDSAPAHDAKPAAAADAHAAPAPAASSSGALEKLIAGNTRYTQNLAAHPNQNSERRISVAMSQKPFAVIFTCADSRVAPEVVFDQGLGDLFVVRVAGNVADPIVMGSIEYAVEHLGAGLVVVMGHERCGAVHAAVTAASSAGDAHDEHDKSENHIGSIVAKIAPAAAEARKATGDITDLAVRLNIENVVNELKTTPGPLASRSTAGKITIIGARYDLDTGAVEFYQPGSPATTTTQVDTH